MTNAVARARELVEEIEGSMLDQFSNPANPEVHRRTTAVEVWEGTGGSIDVFVLAVGTGGTIIGVGEALKLHNAALRVVVVEPAGAALLSGGQPGERQPGLVSAFSPLS